ncbi:MAG TPA: HD domain-containing protein, partial [Bacteroidales bacterium]|nr:HD domain-containing protein [Bacteroidales bacterium]
MNRTEVTIPEILFSPDLETSSAERIQTALTILEKHCEASKEYLPYKEAIYIAEILISELNLTAEPVVAALLRKPFEAGLLSPDEVEKGFGKPVAGIVLGLQKIKSLNNKKFTSNTENFIKFLLTVSEDIRVVLIRLGQCIYDIRNIADLTPEQQKLVVEEANLLYIPIAHRIGLYRIKTELEDRVMAFTQPAVYDELARKIRETQEDRDRYAREFIRPLEKKLREAGFDCEIKSRIKSIPSIYRKMQVQKVEFEKVYDLFAIRIIVNNITESETADCWKVYSIVTDTYTPNSRRLRDW